MKKILKGKYSSARLFTIHIEYSAMKELQTMLNDELLEDCEVVIMPDVCYAGKNCIVGYVQTTKDKIDINTIGADIGCGITLAKTKITHITPSKLDTMIREKIAPISHDEVRFSLDYVCKLFKKYVDLDLDLDAKDLRDMLKTINMSEDLFLRQLLSVGNGNHFIELGKDKDDYITITVHSGSRGFGGKVFKYFVELTKTDKFDKELYKTRIEDIKKTYSGKIISDKIKELKNELTIKRNGNYLTDKQDIDLYKEYMKIAQAYAYINRYLIIKEITSMLDNTEIINVINTMHNYIDSDGIIRKGAIAAHKDKLIIIGLNMAEGLVIASGKGNSDWLFSAPHGLGRLQSRTKAKESLSMEDFKDDMKDIYSTSVNLDTLDESPKAYKSLDMVLPLIEDTCSIEEIIKPILNIKF